METSSALSCVSAGLNPVRLLCSPETLTEEEEVLNTAVGQDGLEQLRRSVCLLGHYSPDSVSTAANHRRSEYDGTKRTGHSCFSV